MGFRLTSFGKVKRKPVKRKRKRVVKRKKRKRVVKRKRKFGSQSTSWIAPGQPHNDIKIARTPPPNGTILYIKYKGTPQYYTVRSNSSILGYDPIIFSGKVLDAFNYPNQDPPFLMILLKITKCSSRPELIGQEVNVYSNRDQISINLIQSKKEKQKEIESAHEALGTWIKNLTTQNKGYDDVSSNILEYVNPEYRYINSDPKTYDPVLYDKAYDFGRRKKKTVKRKRKKVVKRKRKKVVKRKRKKVVKRKKRPYKYRKKKFIPKGIRNAGEWQEFQKQMSGQGYSQKEVAAMYREYLASKPSRFTQMVRSGNISGLTKEGGRIGKNFLYDELKRNARIQGRRELNNLVRSSGGALGILSRGGSRQDVARHLNRMNRTKKNSRLIQAALDSYSDYRNPPRNNPFI